MKRILIRLARVGLLWVRQLKGGSTVSEVKCPDIHLGHLRGVTTCGQEIAIYCQRKEYHVKYDRWYIPDRIKSTYNVFCVVGKNSPELLRKACELDIDLPPLISLWHTEDDIRKAQVRAYLDLLQQRLRKLRQAT